jgi:hypothetical protein
MTFPVFFVHGMGTFTAGWSGTVVQALDKAAANQKYAQFNNNPPSKQIKPVEVLYDPYFVDTLQAWSNLAADVNGQKYLNMDWMKNLDKSKGFIATNVLDVMQWYFLPQIQNQIIDHVAQQIMSNGPLEDIHIIAHSLGTAVIQRTLQAIGSGGFGSVSGKIGSLHMIANVSRVLEDSEAPVYGGATPSLVRPAAAPGDNNFFVFKYYNYHHVIDPIPLVKPFFDPGPGWPSAYYLDTSATYLEGQDVTKVHDFTNYISDPKVHIPILRCLFGYTSVTPAEEAAALAATANPVPLQPGVPLSADLEVFLRTLVDNANLI